MSLLQVFLHLGQWKILENRCHFVLSKLSEKSLSQVKDS